MLTEQQRKARGETIGGSEIASLFYVWRDQQGRTIYRHMFEPPIPGAEPVGCVGRHTTGYRLLQIKAGRLDPDDLDEVERVQAGNYMEPAIAAWAQDKFELPIRQVRRYLEGPVLGMGASLDYEMAKGERAPVEIKNVDGLIFRDLWEADGEEIIAPPIDITLQVQHQIACANTSHGWIVACVGGNRLVRGRIERHQPTIDKITEAVGVFWQGVAAGDDPIALADYDTVSDLYLAAEKGSEIDLSHDNELPSLAARLKLIQSRRKRCEKIEDRYKAMVGARLGDHTKAHLAGGATIGWPIVNRKASTREIAASTYRGAMTIKGI